MRNNIVIIPGYTKIIRPLKNTNTGFLEFIPFLDNQMSLLKEMSVEYIKKTGYHGMFSMEFIRAKDGNDYFFEINLRSDGNYYAVKASGCNLADIWFRNSVEESIQTKHLYAMPGYLDLSFVKNKDISFCRWIMDVIKTRAFAVFSLNDILPFVIQTINLIKSHLMYEYPKKAN